MGRTAPDGKGKKTASRALSLAPDLATAPLPEPAEHPTSSRFKAQGSGHRLSKRFTGAEQPPPQRWGSVAGMGYVASPAKRWMARVSLACPSPVAGSGGS